MNWLVIALLMLLPGSVKADDHVNEALCDEIQSVLREFRQYTTLTPAQVKTIAGNCYGEVDQINAESGKRYHSEEGTQVSEESSETSGAGLAPASVFCDPYFYSCLRNSSSPLLRLYPL